MFKIHRLFMIAPLGLPPLWGFFGPWRNKASTASTPAKMTPIWPTRSKVRWFHSTWPKVPLSELAMAGIRPRSLFMTRMSMTTSATKNSGKMSKWRLLLAHPPVAAGQGDGGDEQDGDQPGDHRDLEHPGVHGVHPEEDQGQEDAGHGQADGAFKQVAAEDGQDGKGDQTNHEKKMHALLLKSDESSWPR